MLWRSSFPRHAAIDMLGEAIRASLTLTVGAPKLLSSTALRPFGPSVTRTASANWFIPDSRARRASSSSIARSRGTLRGRPLPSTATMVTKARVVSALAPLDGSGRVVMRSDDMLEQMLDAARPGDHVVFMSNAGFDAVPSRFCKALRSNERD